jgi:hypothetical protein
MSTNVDTVALSRLRGTDSNSLLRLYDEVRGIVERSQSRQERERAEKAVQRIVGELRKRDVRL